MQYKFLPISEKIVLVFLKNPSLTSANCSRSDPAAYKRAIDQKKLMTGIRRNPAVFLRILFQRIDWLFSESIMSLFRVSRPGRRIYGTGPDSSRSCGGRFWRNVPGSENRIIRRSLRSGNRFASEKVPHGQAVHPSTVPKMIFRRFPGLHDRSSPRKETGIRPDPP